MLQDVEPCIIGFTLIQLGDIVGIPEKSDWTLCDVRTLQKKYPAAVVE